MISNIWTPQRHFCKGVREIYPIGSSCPIVDSHLANPPACFVGSKVQVKSHLYTVFMPICLESCVGWTARVRMEADSSIVGMKVHAIHFDGEAVCLHVNSVCNPIDRIFNWCWGWSRGCWWCDRGCIWETWSLWL